MNLRKRIEKLEQMLKPPEEKEDFSKFTTEEEIDREIEKYMMKLSEAYGLTVAEIRGIFKAGSSFEETFENLEKLSQSKRYNVS